jgi:hypothetical protein
MEVRPNSTADNSSIPQHHRQRHAPAAAPLEQAATLPVPVDTTSVSQRSIQFPSPVTVFLNFLFGLEKRKTRKKEEAYIPYLNFSYPFSRFLGTQSKDYACFVPCFSRFFILKCWIRLPRKLEGKEKKFQNLAVFGSVLLG